MKNPIITEDEKNKIMELGTPRKKVQYIWDYYKMWIIGAAVLICLVVYFIVAFANRDEDAALEVVFVNNYDNISGNSDLLKNFEEYVGEENLGGDVVFDNNAYFDLSRDSDYKNSYFTKVVAYLEAGTAQAVVCQYDNLMGIAQGGRFMDLTDERVSSIYDKYKDSLVYYDSEEGRIPIGIDISEGYNALGLTEYADGRAYIGLSAYTDDFELTEKFIDYIMSQVQ